jgi:hypothetical protein
MKLHQHFEFGPASQDPFTFCQIQLALDTVKDKLYCRQVSFAVPQWTPSREENKTFSAALLLFDAILTNRVSNISQRPNIFVDFLLQRRLALKNHNSLR